MAKFEHLVLQQYYPVTADTHDRDDALEHLVDDVREAFRVAEKYSADHIEVRVYAVPSPARKNTEVSIEKLREIHLQRTDHGTDPCVECMIFDDLTGTS